MWSDWDKKGEKTFGGMAMYPMSSTQDLLKKLKSLVEKLKMKKGLKTELEAIVSTETGQAVPGAVFGNSSKAQDYINSLDPSAKTKVKRRKV